MRGEALPALLYRVHANGAYPLEPSSKSGGGRWDDKRFGASRVFHVLYVGENVETCLIEKLQVFSADDDEAHKIVAEVVEDEADTVSHVQQSVVPSSILRGLAVSLLEALDPTKSVVDPFNPATIKELCVLAEGIGAEVPTFLKAGHITCTDHDFLQCVSTIIFTLTDAAGLVSRSWLDNPRSESIHAVYGLYRGLPEDGGILRAPLRRLRTAAILPTYVEDVRSALACLQVRPEFPLDHPDMTWKPE